uniref:Uncharacterized protein n=1 Tax=Oryctolagus cuniculus TaxID=9986 RepID=A0A5F9D6V4_RABIT
SIHCFYISIGKNFSTFQKKSLWSPVYAGASPSITESSSNGERHGVLHGREST